MGYPPARHLLRDLRVQVSREGGLWSARAPVVPAVCGADGAARASFLAALVDVTGGRTGAALARPGAVLTQELGMHVLRPVSAGEVRANVRVLRDGRNLVAFEVALDDDRGQPVARASMTSVKVRRSSSVDPFAGRSGDWLELALPGSGLAVPLADYAGLRPAGASALEFELSPALSNGLGILHGATQVLVLEAAAERAAGLATARRAVTRDLALRYLAPGRTGPFRASAELLREGKHDCLVRAELVDRGQGDALVAIGWAGIALS
jgi:acyl-coenzyme A thioesterase PaaI-like protein